MDCFSYFLRAYFILIPALWANGTTCSRIQSLRIGSGIMYYIKKFCCNNYFLKNGECIECGIGFTTENGGNCTRCPNNTYGKKCAEICSCSVQEKCNNVKGCVPKTYIDTTSKLLQNTVDTSDNLSVTMAVSGSAYTYMSIVSTTEKGADASTLQSTNGTTTNFFLPTGKYISEKEISTLAEVDNHDNSKENEMLSIGLSRRELVVYSTGGVLFAIVLIASFACRYTFFKRKSKKALVQNESSPNMSATIEENYSDVVYEEIDENALETVLNTTFLQNSDIETFHNKEIDSSSEGSSVENVDTEGYLHPYNSFIRRKKIEEQISSCHDEENSSKQLEECHENYTRLYEPLKTLNDHFTEYTKYNPVYLELS